MRWDATAEQQRALGAALWGWCNGAAGDAGIYQYLDNQGLAGIGRLQRTRADRRPELAPGGREGVSVPAMNRLKIGIASVGITTGAERPRQATSPALCVGRWRGVKGLLESE